MGCSLSQRSQGTSSLSPARMQASAALRLVQEQGAFVSAAIDRTINEHGLTKEDERFAAALAIGVVQTQGALDQALNRFLDKPGRVRPDTRRALQIAAYEILFMGREPQHAVDQGVRLVRKSAPYAKGLANAVLRRVAEHREELLGGKEAVGLPEICAQEGFPVPLAQRIEEERGCARACSLVRSFRDRAPVFLYINGLRTSRDATLGCLDNSSIAYEIIDDVPGCIRLARSQDVAHPCVSNLIQQGMLVVSDLAAQLVALSCVRDTLPPSFLEIGAGRGTKTVLIQSMAHALHGSQIPQYVCVDNVASKRKVLLDRARLCGAQVDECVITDGRFLEDALTPQCFHTVLLDAPCSGLGTLRRHPEITWKVTDEDIEALAEVQAGLLSSAAALVAPHGRLVYATCTITYAEDEEQVDGFLTTEAGAAFQWAGGFATVGDGWGADAHFQATFSRSSGD